MSFLYTVVEVDGYTITCNNCGMETKVQHASGGFDDLSNVVFIQCDPCSEGIKTHSDLPVAVLAKWKDSDNMSE